MSLEKWMGEPDQRKEFWRAILLFIGLFVFIGFFVWLYNWILS